MHQPNSCRVCCTCFWSNQNVQLSFIALAILTTWGVLSFTISTGFSIPFPLALVWVCAIVWSATSLGVFITELKNIIVSNNTCVDTLTKWHIPFVSLLYTPMWIFFCLLIDTTFYNNPILIAGATALTIFPLLILYCILYMLFSCIHNSILKCVEECKQTSLTLSSQEKIIVVVAPPAYTHIY